MFSVNGPYWIGYDDVESFTLKAKFINHLGIAGGMVWSIDTDDFRGDFFPETFPMLRVSHIKHLLQLPFMHTVCTWTYLYDF
jgi:GH18 family chitinase